MVGNGLQGTLLGVRGESAGFSTFEMSVVMSGYFLGFLFASRSVPALIRKVGHVRVFAALASMISAVFVLYPILEHPVYWTIGRAIIGFCFCGVYVTAESWLNNSSTNETRGQAMSIYMIVQMSGVVGAQALMLVPDPTGFLLYVIPSVLISIAFAPILLSARPTPAFERTQPMSLTELMKASPLGCVGMFLLGGVFSAQFGMGAVYGAEIGLSLPQISAFVATFYIGALLLQYPIGWISDRLDRRLMIAATALAGTAGAIIGMMQDDQFNLLLLAAFLIGGASNPLYSLLIAHTNDYLEYDDMAAASGGLLFLNGLGAISGPIVTGWLMGPTLIGPSGYFFIMVILMAVMAAYATYRMTQRPSVSVEEAATYAVLTPTATQIAWDAMQEAAVEAEVDANEPLPQS